MERNRLSTTANSPEPRAAVQGSAHTQDDFRSQQPIPSASTVQLKLSAFFFKKYRQDLILQTRRCTWLRNGHPEVAQALVQAGADTTAQDDYG